MLSHKLAILPALALFLAAGGPAFADEAKTQGFDLENEASGGSLSDNRTGDLSSTGSATTKNGGSGTVLGGGMHKGLNVQYGTKGSFGLGGGSSTESAEATDSDDGSKSK